MAVIQMLRIVLSIEEANVATVGTCCRPLESSMDPPIPSGTIDLINHHHHLLYLC